MLLLLLFINAMSYFSVFRCNLICVTNIVLSSLAFFLFNSTLIFGFLLQAVSVLKGSLEVTMIVRYFPYGEPFSFFLLFSYHVLHRFHCLKSQLFSDYA